MKIKIIFLLTVILLLTDISAFASYPQVSAKSALLMCAENGKVIYSKNADDRLPMASTTKIMTSLLALEAATPFREIIVTKEMVGVEGTSMGLLEGDSVSLIELVHGMLLQSGNDAANTVAYALAGSPEKFAVMMNERAKLIAMANTNFVTASGLDDENHYSTAYDMALLARECINNPLFSSVCSKKNATLTYGNPPYSRTLTNHNRLLWSYEDCVGIKTGFTKKSGRCLVSAAEKDGVTLVAVTLNAPDDWNDHIRMLDYGFSQCKSLKLTCDTSGVYVNVAGGTHSNVPVRLFGNAVCPDESEYKVRLLLKPFVYAPVEKGDIVGTALFISDNKVVCEVPLAADDSVGFRYAQADSGKNYDHFFTCFFDKIQDLFSFQR